MVGTKVCISIPTPSTPEEWGLYVDTCPKPHLFLAAEGLTRVLRLAIYAVGDGVSPEGAYRDCIAPTAGRYEALGACDPRVREIAMAILNDLAQYCTRD